MNCGCEHDSQKGVFKMELFKKANLGNKSYSRRHGLYSAVWLDDHGNPAFWGSYNPDDGSFYLSTPDSTLASGMWLEHGDGDYEFQHQGCYHYDDVRKAVQLGIF